MNLPLSTQEEVCSPVHRCFPPKPTICLFCRQTSTAECPFKVKAK